MNFPQALKNIEENKDSSTDNIILVLKVYTQSWTQNISLHNCGIWTLPLYAGKGMHEVLV